MYCIVFGHSAVRYSFSQIRTSDQTNPETSTRQRTILKHTYIHTSMSPAGFEPPFQAGEWPQTHTLDRDGYWNRHAIPLQAWTGP
jgi:hypothetical protein